MKSELVLILVGLFTLSSLAQARNQKNQIHRIREGVKSGELTKDEAKELRQDEKQIRQEKKKMKEDGNLSPEEKAKLQQDLKTESQKIYDLKHNDQKRPGATGTTEATPPSQ